ncbi:hypothetical protein JCM21900_001452 [Sporobolomyces salmonicolor]
MLVLFFSIMLQSAMIGAQSASGIELSQMETIFAFGDSYSYTGYQPQTGLNNLQGIGNTSSGGLNWVQYLAASNPATASSYYDLAYSGATTNRSIVTASEGTPAFVDQVILWEQYFDPAPNEVPWKSNTTLFAAWFGINDVGFSYVDGKNLTEELPAIFDTWDRLINVLYQGGARNFLVMGIPPMQRTPLVQSYGEAAQDIFAAYISEYNVALSDYTTRIPTYYAGAKVALFDTQPFFNAILDSPTDYGFIDSTAYCNVYAGITNQPNITLPACTWPLAEYTWWNEYHPTWPVHKLLADVVATTLASPANTTASSSGTSTTAYPSTYIPTTSPTVTTPAASTASGSVGPSSTGKGKSNSARRSAGGRAGCTTAGAVVLGAVLGAAGVGLF